jgi:hypothetical protein
MLVGTDSGTLVQEISAADGEDDKMMMLETLETQEAGTTTGLDHSLGTKI